jgi:hypothetical protein
MVSARARLPNPCSPSGLLNREDDRTAMTSPPAGSVTEVIDGDRIVIDAGMPLLVDLG